MTRNVKVIQTVAAAAACWLVPLTVAQQGGRANVATNTVQQAADVAMIPWAAPRSLGLPGVFDQRNLVTTPPVDLNTVLAEDAAGHGGPARMGIIQKLESRDQRTGQWTKLKDGGWLYTLWVHATGAHAIRLRIPDWNPPAEAELIAYSPNAPQYAPGPVTRLWLLEPGELWTPTVYGDEVYVEYYLPPHIDHELPAVQIRIDAVLNQYRAIGDELALAVVSCHRDVGCYGQWATSAAGVGLTSFIGGGTLPGGFYCTALMLTRIGGDFTPLLATATHCTMASNNASNLEVTWTYQSPGCGGPTPEPNSLPRSRAAGLLFNDAATDWMMLGLLSDNTGGVAFLGWDNGGWANNSVATGIHHPDRSYKRISFGTKISDTGTRPSGGSCVDGTAILVNYTVGNGLTEPGSSGSPIFDATQRVRGVESCGSAVTCSGDNAATYGRLEQAYPIAQAYLDPVDPVFVNWSYGGAERGTAGQPMNRFIEGVYAVQRTRNLFIQAGNYNERLTIDKAMTLNASGGTVVIGQ